MNKIYVACAGSGKTRLIVEDVMGRFDAQESEKRIAIITYTSTNQANIVLRLKRRFKVIPQRILVIGWYSFLLDYWIRPFKGTVIGSLFGRHVGLLFVSGRSGYTKTKDGRTIATFHNDEEKFLSASKDKMFSDKLSEFAFKCNQRNKKDLLEHLNGIFEAIYIDEGQDLSGYDFDVCKIMIEKGTFPLTICTDPRQCTYSTNPGMKYKTYKGRIDQFAIDRINQKHIEVDYSTLSKSHRCCQEICNVASEIVSEYPRMEACKCERCSEQRLQFPFDRGVYFLKRSDVTVFSSLFNPLTLTWNTRTVISNQTKKRLNFGESKGLQDNVSLIYPTGKILNFLCDGDRETLSKEAACKFYVAVTRAKYITAIVVPDDFDKRTSEIPFWEGTSSYLVSG